MAQENCLSAHGARQHPPGDSLRLLRRNPRRAGWGSPGRRHRGCVLGRGCAPRSHGQRGKVAATAFRMVAGHHFLFSGLVFFLQDADVRKNEALALQKWKNVCAPTTSSITLDQFEPNFSATFSSFSWILLLQPLLELQQAARRARGTVNNSHRTTQHGGKT